MSKYQKRENILKETRTRLRVGLQLVVGIGKGGVKKTKIIAKIM